VLNKKDLPNGKPFNMMYPICTYNTGLPFRQVMMVMMCVNDQLFIFYGAKIRYTFYPAKF